MPGEHSVHAVTQGKSWHRSYHDRVEYGTAQTDDRLLWISCKSDDVLQIGCPLFSSIALPDKVNVTFSRTSDGATQTLPGAVSEMGDGLNFIVQSRDNGMAILTLLKGESITVTIADISWTVGAEKAAIEIKTLIKHCQRSAA